MEPLPPGAVVPSLNAANIVDPKAVSDALLQVFERIGARPKRVALAIPDSRRQSLAPALREGAGARRAISKS